MNESDFPIVMKVQDILQWLLPQLAKFPRSQRFTLGKRMEDELFALRDAFIRALNGIEPRRSLMKASGILDGFRLTLRLAVEMGYIPAKKYHYLCGEMDAVGRMLGGWLKKASA